MDLVKRFEQCVSEKEDIGGNLTAAWHYLVNRVLKTTERPTDWGLLETSLVCDTHRVFQRFRKGLTPPGKLSSRPRYCDLDDGNRHWYPVPDDMGEALTSLLDSYNARYDTCRHQNDLFRTCACLLSSFLVLHPFADGDGRMAQVLCSYALFQPVPVCNEDDYLPTLLEAQSTGKLVALTNCVARSLRRLERVFRCYIACETMEDYQEGCLMVWANYMSPCNSIIGLYFKGTCDVISVTMATHEVHKSVL